MIKDTYKTNEGKEKILSLYNNIISKWNFEYETTKISTSFGNTFILTAGNPSMPTLVLLHGSSSCLLSWGHLIPLYVSKYYVVAIDIPGEPGKSNPKRLSINDNEYIKWFNELTIKLNLNKFVLCAQSFGGWIALKFLTQYSNKVIKAVLLSPGGLISPKKLVIWKFIWYSLQGKRGMTKIKKMILGTENIDPFLSKYIDLVTKYCNQTYSTLPVFDNLALKDIESEVLIIAGENDCFYDFKKASEKLQNINTNITFKILPKTHHGYEQTPKSLDSFLS